MDQLLTTYRTPGRPPKDPVNRVGWPIRALVTKRVLAALTTVMDNTGLHGRNEGEISSDVVRLAVFRMLDQMGLMTEELRNDPSWDTLKLSGHV